MENCPDCGLPVEEGHVCATATPAEAPVEEVVEVAPEVEEPVAE